MYEIRNLKLILNYVKLCMGDVHFIDDALVTRALVQASVLLDSKLHFPHT
jgi:hypothetical protein